MIQNFSPDTNSSLKSDKMVLIWMEIYKPTCTPEHENKQTKL